MTEKKKPRKKKKKSTQLKIIVIGDSAVGKTSILKRYTNNVFIEDHKKTIGVDFYHKKGEYNGKSYVFGYWDTAGQEKFQSLMPDYYRGSKGVIFVFDITQIASFQHIKVWKREVEKYVDSEQYCPILVGNKLDLDHIRTVKRVKGEYFAENNGMMYIETSAKTSVNVSNAFEFIMKKVAESSVSIGLEGSLDEEAVILKPKKMKNIKRKKEIEEVEKAEEVGGCCFSSN